MDEQKYCAYCGADEQKYCVYCGAAISPGAALCAECGSKTLMTSTSPSATPPPSTLFLSHFINILVQALTLGKYQPVARTR